MPTENYSHSAKFAELLNSTYIELHWGLEEDGKGPVKQTKQTHKTTNKHQNQSSPHFSNFKRLHYIVSFKLFVLSQVANPYCTLCISSKASFSPEHRKLGHLVPLSPSQLSKRITAGSMALHTLFAPIWHSSMVMPFCPNSPLKGCRTSLPLILFSVCSWYREKKMTAVDLYGPGQQLHAKYW